jgi:hypothetical protein
MLPVLAGPKYRATCPSCAFTSCKDSWIDPSRCPNCRQIIPSTLGHPVAGDHVGVIKSDPALLRRFDVVAFKSPEEPRTMLVKRIVGLPGETIRVAQGEIERRDPSSDQFEVCRKRAEQILQGARVIYDDRFRWPAGPPRWQSSENGWLPIKQGYQLLKQEATLTYVHLGRSGQETTIDDDEPFQQADTPTSPVHDLILDFTWNPHDNASVVTLELSSVVDHGTLVIRNESMELIARSLPQRKIVVSAGTQAGRWRIGFVDRSWLVWKEERLLGHWTIPANSDLSKTYAQNEAGVRIRGQGVGSVITDLVLSRDVHYRTYAWGDDIRAKDDPLWGTSATTWSLGPDEYLTFGDFAARSRDSRHWPKGHAVPGRLIVGTILGRLSFAEGPSVSRIVRSPETVEKPPGDRPKDQRAWPMARQEETLDPLR